MNLRFISNSLLPITLPLRTHYIIKKRKIKAHFQTLNPYSAENLSKEIRVGDQSRNFVNPYLVQAGGLLPTDCCYSGKIEVNIIVLYLYQETYNQQVTKKFHVTRNLTSNQPEVQGGLPSSLPVATAQIHKQKPYLHNLSLQIALYRQLNKA